MRYTKWRRILWCSIEEKRRCRSEVRNLIFSKLYTFWYSARAPVWYLNNISEMKLHRWMMPHNVILFSFRRCNSERSRNRNAWSVNLNDLFKFRINFNFNFNLIEFSNKPGRYSQSDNYLLNLKWEQDRFSLFKMIFQMIGSQ